MNILQWLTARFSNRGKALSLYRRGVNKAKQHDHKGAIDDYTSTIVARDTSASLRAMALYNRALAYAEAGQQNNAIADLNQILAMPETLATVKTETRRRLLRMQRRSDAVT